MKAILAHIQDINDVAGLLAALRKRFIFRQFTADVERDRVVYVTNGDACVDLMREFCAGYLAGCRSKV